MQNWTRALDSVDLYVGSEFVSMLCVYSIHHSRSIKLSDLFRWKIAGTEPIMRDGRESDNGHDWHSKRVSGAHHKKVRAKSSKSNQPLVGMERY